MIRTVAAHQPHYLPWLGYLAKVAAADVFVVMDDLQYEAQNFQNRQRIKLADGPHWLTVPLQQAARAARICDRRIDNTGFGRRHHWATRHWRSLEVHYGRAPQFALRAPALEAVFRTRWEFLLDLDLHLFDLARLWLAIPTKVIRASTLRLRGERTARIASLCEATGATHYLSGTGGSRDYLDRALLARAGIELAWHAYEHPTYAQQYPHLGFIPRLGFLDFVLNQPAEVQRAAA